MSMCPTTTSLAWDIFLPELHFEAATYASLQENPAIPFSRPVYFRMPVQQPGHKVNVPTNIDGRRVMVFERVEGKNKVWMSWICI